MSIASLRQWEKEHEAKEFEESDEPDISELELDKPFGNRLPSPQPVVHKFDSLDDSDNDEELDDSGNDEELDDNDEPDIEDLEAKDKVPPSGVHGGVKSHVRLTPFRREFGLASKPYLENLHESLMNGPISILPRLPSKKAPSYHPIETKIDVSGRPLCYNCNTPQSQPLIIDHKSFCLACGLIKLVSSKLSQDSQLRIAKATGFDILDLKNARAELSRMKRTNSRIPSSSFKNSLQ